MAHQSRAAQIKAAERQKARWAAMKDGTAYKHYDTSGGFGSADQWRDGAGGNTTPFLDFVYKPDADLQAFGLATLPARLSVLVAAYHAAALAAHPDTGGSHAAFLALTAAYARLRKRLRA